MKVKSEEKHWKGWNIANKSTRSKSFPMECLAEWVSPQSTPANREVINAASSSHVSPAFTASMLTCIPYPHVKRWSSLCAARLCWILWFWEVNRGENAVHEICRVCVIEKLEGLTNFFTKCFKRIFQHFFRLFREVQRIIFISSRNFRAFERY